MKLPYVLALALHIALTKQINVEASNTGLRPKLVLNGTLQTH